MIRGTRTRALEFSPQKYIPDGQWKLISIDSDTSWHLYRISEDQTELPMILQMEPMRRYAPGIS